MTDLTSFEFLSFVDSVYNLPKDLKYMNELGFQRAADGGT